VSVFARRSGARARVTDTVALRPLGEDRAAGPSASCSYLATEKLLGRSAARPVRPDTEMYYDWGEEARLR